MAFPNMVFHDRDFQRSSRNLKASTGNFSFHASISAHKISNQKEKQKTNRIDNNTSKMIQTHWFPKLKKTLPNVNGNKVFVITGTTSGAGYISWGEKSSSSTVTPVRSPRCSTNYSLKFQMESLSFLNVISKISLRFTMPFKRSRVTSTPTYTASQTTEQGLTATTHKSRRIACLTFY
jgi:hypothetical protein